MSTVTPDDARLTVLLPNDLKQAIEFAATESGQSVSEFAVASLARAARDFIEDRDRTELSDRDREVFLGMLSDMNAEPNEALRSAAEEYKRSMG